MQSYTSKSILFAFCLYCFLLPVSINAGPMRIMPVGDSITAGYTDNPVWNSPFDFGYRSRLCSLLKDAGYDFLLVGTSPEPFNNKWGDPSHGGTVTPIPDLRAMGQNGHRGYGGVGLGHFNRHIKAYLAEDNPDLILLMIGINGIDSSSPEQLNTLVGRIFEAKPEVRLIVAQITPRAVYNADLKNYNAYIRDTLVPAYRAQGRKITTVDQYVNFLKDPNDPTSIDGAKFSNRINHPTQSGYQLMAATWMRGIQEQFADVKPTQTPTNP